MPGETAGWHYGFQYSWADKESLAEACHVNGYIHKVQVTFPDGSQHEFRPFGYPDKNGYFRIGPDGWIESESGNCDSQSSATLATTAPMTYYSTDGTYLRLDTNLRFTELSGRCYGIVRWLGILRPVVFLMILRNSDGKVSVCLDITEVISSVTAFI